MHQALVLDIRHDGRGNPYLYFPFMSVSDTHWGTKHSRASRLSHMFEHTQTAKLFLVGDMIDGEYMLGKKRWKLPPWHRQGIAHICRKAERGTEITYIPGNHDANIRYKKMTGGDTNRVHRNLCGKSILGINVAAHSVYTDPLDRKFLLIHGDQYDRTLKAAPIGDAALEVMYNVDTYFQRLPGCAHISLAAKGKRAVKKVIDKAWSIRNHIAAEVDGDPTLSGIVTGHSHISEISRTPGDKLLINDGCCTEHVEALVQDKNGTFALLEWHESYLKIRYEGNRTQIYSWKDLGLNSFRNPPQSIEDASTDKADRLIRLIYRAWPPKERQRMRKRGEFTYATGMVTGGSTPAYIPLPNPHRVIRLHPKSDANGSGLNASLVA